jgi:tetratricopeptide (TPR) repeat protein
MWASAGLVVLLLLLQADHGARGLKALEEGKWAEAAEALERAVAADPTDYGAQFNLAFANTMLGKKAEAIGGYQKVLELKPGLYQAQLNLGILLLEEKQESKALPLLRAAATQAPDKFPPNFYLAQALYAAADDAGAEQSYRKAVELDAKAAVAWIGLGRALANQSKFEEALEAYRKAGEADPSHREYLIELAARLEEKGHPERAIALYREFPGRPEVRERLGNLLFQAGQIEEAIPHLEAAVKESPTAANRFALAAAYLKSKRPEEAGPLLELALRDSPENLELRMTYGRLLRDLKKYGAAAREFLEAAKIAPQSKEAWSELAGMLVLLDNHPQALVALDRVQALDPQNAGVHFFRAMILDRSKQYEPALNSYEKFLAMANGAYPDEEFKARQRMKVIRKELNRR